MTKNKLYGALLGDLVGKPYEFPAGGGPREVEVDMHNPDSQLTDDSVMTLAGADYILNAQNDQTLEMFYKKWGHFYPECGFGGGFKEWLTTPFGTVNDSWGNGCIMRVSPFMYLPNPFVAAVDSCLNSHAHEYSIISVMELVNLYKLANEYISEKFTSLARKHPVIKPFDKFDVSAVGTIGFINDLFFHSYSTHQAIKDAIWAGGDTDTTASIIGELMNYTFDDLTKEDIEYVESKLDERQLSVIREFNERFK